jgi:hypothetical protein
MLLQIENVTCPTSRQKFYRNVNSLSNKKPKGVLCRILQKVGFSDYVACPASNGLRFQNRKMRSDGEASVRAREVSHPTAKPSPERVYDMFLQIEASRVTNPDEQNEQPPNSMGG